MAPNIVAVGGDASSVKSATSPDGATWTTHGTSTPFAFNTDINAIAWSPALGLFVAVGEVGSIGTSTDGAAWTSQTNPFTNNTREVQGACWSPDRDEFLICNDNNQVAVSSDGVSWAANRTASNLSLNACIWVPALSLYVVVGQSGTIITSPDGSTWTARTSGTTSAFHAIEWSPTLGLLIAMSNNGTNHFTSPNGVTWTARAHGYTTSFPQDAAWSEDLGLWVNVGGAIIRSSTDGLSWTTETCPVTGLGTVCWAPQAGLFVAAGSAGAMCTSPDGSTWTSRTSGFSTLINDVVEGESVGRGLVVGSMTLN